MGHRPTIIIQRITRPDTAIGIVKMVAIRVIVTFLPSQMTLDDGPHLAHIGCVSIILEMPKQFIDIIQVHIVVMHLVVSLRIATDITIRIHLRAPFFLGSGKIERRVLRGMRNRGFHIRYLTLGIGIEMTHGPVIPSQHISQIACAPTCQRHPPSHTTMQPRLPVPVAIGGQRQSTAKGINIRVGGLEMDSGSQVLVVFQRLLEVLLPFLGTHFHHLVNHHFQIVFCSQYNINHLYRIAHSLKHTRSISSDVTITMQFGLHDTTDKHF